VNGEEGLKSLEVVTAMYESAKTSQKIAIK